MIWWVHRPNGPGTPISWAGQYAQPGYADEQLDDATSAELQAFLNPPPSRVQLAAQAFAKGCQIVSTSTPSLSATYAIMPQDEINWTGIQSAINANQPWPGYIRDINGIKKVVGAAQATAVLDAILQYIAGIDQYVHGEVAALPAQPVMIA